MTIRHLLYAEQKKNASEGKTASGKPITGRRTDRIEGRWLSRNDMQRRELPFGWCFEDDLAQLHLWRSAAEWRELKEKK